MNNLAIAVLLCRISLFIAAAIPTNQTVSSTLTPRQEHQSSQSHQTTTQGVTFNGNAIMQQGVTYIPYMSLQNNSIMYQRCSSSNTMCENSGVCYESLTRPTISFCRCGENNYGKYCEEEDANMYKKVLFGVALLAGIILIFAIAACCQLYMKSGDVKDYRQSYDDLASTLQRYRHNTRSTTLDSRDSYAIRAVRPISLSASSYVESDRLRSNGSGSTSPSPFYRHSSYVESDRPRSNGSRSPSPSPFYKHNDAYVKGRAPSPTVIVTKPEKKHFFNTPNQSVKSRSESSYEIDNPVFDIDDIERPRSTTIGSTEVLTMDDVTGLDVMIEKECTENAQTDVNKQLEQEENNNKSNLLQNEGNIDKTKLFPDLLGENNLMQNEMPSL